MTALVNFEYMTLSPFRYLILCLAAAQHLGKACINQLIYNEGERRSILLFFNTEYTVHALMIMVFG